jgi:hypothetical protein
VWALVENRSVVFQEAVDGALSVHGLVSVHAVVNSGEMLDQFPPLDGTLPVYFPHPGTPSKPREVRFALDWAARLK